MLIFWRAGRGALALARVGGVSRTEDGVSQIVVPSGACDSISNHVAHTADGEDGGVAEEVGAKVGTGHGEGDARHDKQPLQHELRHEAVVVLAQGRAARVLTDHSDHAADAYGVEDDPPLALGGLALGGPARVQRRHLAPHTLR